LLHSAVGGCQTGPKANPRSKPVSRQSVIFRLLSPPPGCNRPKVFSTQILSFHPRLHRSKTDCHNRAIADNFRHDRASIFRNGGASGAINFCKNVSSLCPWRCGAGAYPISDAAPAHPGSDYCCDRRQPSGRRGCHSSVAKHPFATERVLPYAKLVMGSFHRGFVVFPLHLATTLLRPTGNVRPETGLVDVVSVVVGISVCGCVHFVLWLRTVAAQTSRSFSGNLASSSHDLPKMQ